MISLKDHFQHLFVRHGGKRRVHISRQGIIGKNVYMLSRDGLMGYPILDKNYRHIAARRKMLRKKILRTLLWTMTDDIERCFGHNFSKRSERENTLCY